MMSQESHASRDPELSKLLSSLKRKIDGNRKQKEALTDSKFVGRRKPVMYRVPDVLRAQKDHAYSPTTVSIGPLHRGKEGLQAMEAVKLSYMCCLFERTKDFNKTQQACMAVMLKKEDLVRNCYEEAAAAAKLDENGKPVISELNTEEEDYRLTEIMLIDGCFIIELIYKNYLKDYDPILWNPFKYYAVQHDLLLLENQIPFFVLQDLFSMVMGFIIPTKSNPRRGGHSLSLTRCLLLFFGDMVGTENGGIYHNSELEKKHYSTTPYHILHFFHIHYLPSSTYDDDDENIASKIEYHEPIKAIYSATKLHLAGVKFKPRKRRNLFHIKFSAARSCGFCFCLCTRSCLEVPPFSISEYTEPFLRNLIAFEQCCPWIESYFTSHAFLMNILIHNAQDVELLEEAQVMCNLLSSSEAASQIFTAICKNVVFRQFHYNKQCNKLMYSFKPWRVSVGKLKRDYFGNPWSAISVIAAIALFALAFLQTIFTILSLKSGSDK